MPKGSGGGIDHLLIGPGGVFTINTKHHQGAPVWVGNARADLSGAPARADPPRPARSRRRHLARHLRTALLRSQ
ncbi:nuclease-related domain-containing protein [Streptomyces sp. NPDC057620]|uniref:nuclease-related domain-containing protein n=1 Tax=Streptomyces sp. NPDC057620 TaxID=3346185 RepID=UPI003688B44A